MVRRSKQQIGKARALDEGLQGMFRSLEQRALPDCLRSVVDQLEVPEAPARKRAV